MYSFIIFEMYLEILYHVANSWRSFSRNATYSFCRSWTRHEDEHGIKSCYSQDIYSLRILLFFKNVFLYHILNCNTFYKIVQEWCYSLTNGARISLCFTKAFTSECIFVHVFYFKIVYCILFFKNVNRNCYSLDDLLVFWCNLVLRM